MLACGDRELKILSFRVPSKTETTLVFETLERVSYLLFVCLLFVLKDSLEPEKCRVTVRKWLSSLQRPTNGHRFISLSSSHTHKHTYYTNT